MVIKINEEFQKLIPPLEKDEYRELEKSILREGCREALVTWNGFLLDGHNRYEICTHHHIPFQTIEMFFPNTEEAIAWICTNQLARRSISEEVRKYLIGKRYEAEKVIGERKGNRGANQYTKKSDNKGPRKTPDYRHRTADKLGQEYHLSHSSIRNYGTLARVVDRISARTPQLAQEILAGNVKVSQQGLLELDNMNDENLGTVALNISKQGTHISYKMFRKEIGSVTTPLESIKHKSPRSFSAKPISSTNTASPVKSIKDMPKFDPDADIIGLTLTIPSWYSSMDRVINNVNPTHLSRSAQHNLIKALAKLQSRIDKIKVIVGDKNNE